MPHHDRGSGEQVHPRLRPDHRLPLGRRLRRPARRRHGVRRRRDHAHFDSLLVKLTCRGRDLPDRGAPRPARARGVPHPRRQDEHPVPRGVLADPVFQRGAATTTFIDETPELLAARMGGDRGDQAAHLPRRRHRQPAERPGHDASLARAPSSRRSTRRARCRPAPATGCCESGPAAFAAALRERERVAVTDTTFRDAHQSLLATRVRTRDMLHVAPHVARLTPQLFSLEMWGGATFDVALRFLDEDPWERLAELREAMPNILFQMLLRGRNAVGYTHYPTASPTRSSARRRATGHRHLPHLRRAQRRVPDAPAIEAVLETGTAVAEVAICYTGDMLDPGEKLYTLDYYLRLAEQIVDAGAHVLAIKDMAGLLRAAGRGTGWSRRCASGSTCRCTSTPTTPPAASSAPCSPRSTPASTPSTPPARRWRARRASRRCRPSSRRPTTPTARPGSTSSTSSTLEPYWEAVRQLYAPFESGLPPPPAACTTTRSPAASSRTCASRRSRSASGTTSRRSRTCTPRPTASSATSSR